MSDQQVMFNEELFDFLSTEERTDIQIGGVFTPSGFIAPWQARIQYSYGTGPEQEEFSKEQVGYDLKRKTGSWFWYYWNNEDAALAAKTLMSKQFPPSQEWIWVCDTDDVLNLSVEIRPKFGDTIFYSAKMAGPASKYGAEFNLISLPLAVATVATMHEIDNPGFDVTDILRVDENTDHSFLAEYIGGGSVKLTDSILYKRRAELWKALGETNLNAVRPIGATLPSGKPDIDKAATSTTLNACFGIYTKNWEKPAWVRLVPVPDLRSDAITNSGKRLTLPGFWQMFKTKEEAVIAARDESSMRAASAEGATEEDIPAGPPLPKMFEGYSREWQTTLNKIQAEIATGRPLVAVYADNGGETTLGCTIPELQAHLDFKVAGQAPAQPASQPLAEDEIPF